MTFEGRIYYCGHVDGDVISKLAAVGAGRKDKRCGNTACHRCDCAEAHQDARTVPEGQKIADHPMFLCDEHYELYED